VATLTRVTAFTPLTAANLNADKDEIERLATGLFGNTTNTSRPRFLVKRTSTLSISNTTDTVVTWQSAVSDPRGMFDAGTPTVITVQSGDGGDWLLIGQERWPASASGSRAGKILLNGSNPNTNALSSGKLPGQSDGEGTTVGLIALARLVAGDVLGLNAWQSAGSSQTLEITNGGTFFGGVWLGP
jgi:hypothetical protein